MGELAVSDHGQAGLETDEVEVITRFVNALQDLGVQAVLLSVNSIGNGGDEFGGQTLRTHINMVSKTHPDRMHDAGVSFKVIHGIAVDANIFPEDFLPSAETVDKCLDNFWANMRSGAKR